MTPFTLTQVFDADLFKPYSSDIITIRSNRSEVNVTCSGNGTLIFNGIVIPNKTGLFPTGSRIGVRGISPGTYNQSTVITLTIEDQSAVYIISAPQRKGLVADIDRNTPPIDYSGYLECSSSTKILSSIDTIDTSKDFNCEDAGEPLNLTPSKISDVDYIIDADGLFIEAQDGSYLGYVEYGAGVLIEHTNAYLVDHEGDTFTYIDPLGMIQEFSPSGIYGVNYSIYNSTDGVNLVFAPSLFNKDSLSLSSIDITDSLLTLYGDYPPLDNSLTPTEFEIRAFSIDSLVIVSDSGEDVLVDETGDPLTYYVDTDPVGTYCNGTESEISIYSSERFFLENFTDPSSCSNTSRPTLPFGYSLHSVFVDINNEVLTLDDDSDSVIAFITDDVLARYNPSNDEVLLADFYNGRIYRYNPELRIYLEEIKALGQPYRASYVRGIRDDTPNYILATDYSGRLVSYTPKTFLSACYGDESLYDLLGYTARYYLELEFGVLDFCLAGPYFVFVTNFVSGKVYKILYSANDNGHMRLFDSYSLGSRIHSVAYDSKNQTLWATDYGIDQVYVIDLETEQVIVTHSVGRGPTAIIYVEETDTIWISCVFDGTVEIYDGETKALQHTIQSLWFILGFMMNQKDFYVYITDAAYGTTFRISIFDYKIVKVGSYDLVVNAIPTPVPDLYLSNYYSHFVYKNLFAYTLLYLSELQLTYSDFTDANPCDLNVYVESNIIRAYGFIGTQRLTMEQDLVNAFFIINGNPVVETELDIVSCDTLSILALSEPDYSATRSIRAVLGNRLLTFALTTYRELYLIDGLAFIPQYDVELNLIVVSNEVTVKYSKKVDDSYTETLKVDSTNGTNTVLYKNSVPVGLFTTVKRGDRIKVAVTSSQDYNTAVIVVVRLGIYTSPFYVKTRVDNFISQQDIYGFIDLFQQEISTTITSNTVTLTPSHDSYISVQQAFSGLLLVNDEDVGCCSSLLANQTYSLRLQLTTLPQYALSHFIWVDIESIESHNPSSNLIWEVRTKDWDMIDPLNFTPICEALLPYITYESETRTVTCEQNPSIVVRASISEGVLILNGVPQNTYVTQLTYICDLRVGDEVSIQIATGTMMGVSKEYKIRLNSDTVQYDDLWYVTTRKLPPKTVNTNEGLRYKTKESQAALIADGESVRHSVVLGIEGIFEYGEIDVSYNGGSYVLVGMDDSQSYFVYHFERIPGSGRPAIYGTSNVVETFTGVVQALWDKNGSIYVDTHSTGFSVDKIHTLAVSSALRKVRVDSLYVTGNDTTSLPIRDYHVTTTDSYDGFFDDRHEKVTDEHLRGAWVDKTYRFLVDQHSEGFIYTKHQVIRLNERIKQALVAYIDSMRVDEHLIGPYSIKATPQVIDRLFNGQQFIKASHQETDEHSTGFVMLKITPFYTDTHATAFYPKTLYHIELEQRYLTPVVDSGYIVVDTEQHPYYDTVYRFKHDVASEGFETIRRKQAETQHTVGPYMGRVLTMFVDSAVAGSVVTHKRQLLSPHITDAYFAKAKLVIDIEGREVVAADKAIHAINHLTGILPTRTKVVLDKEGKDVVVAERDPHFISHLASIINYRPTLYRDSFLEGTLLNRSPVKLLDRTGNFNDYRKTVKLNILIENVNYRATHGHLKLDLHSTKIIDTRTYKGIAEDLDFVWSRTRLQNLHLAKELNRQAAKLFPTLYSSELNMDVLITWMTLHLPVLHHSLAEKYLSNSLMLVEQSFSIIPKEEATVVAKHIESILFKATSSITTLPKDSLNTVTVMESLLRTAKNISQIASRYVNNHLVVLLEDVIKTSKSGLPIEFGETVFRPNTAHALETIYDIVPYAGSKLLTEQFISFVARESRVKTDSSLEPADLVIRSMILAGVFEPKRIFSSSRIDTYLLSALIHSIQRQLDKLGIPVSSRLSQVAINDEVEPDIRKPAVRLEDLFSAPLVNRLVGLLTSDDVLEPVARTASMLLTYLTTGIVHNVKSFVVDSEGLSPEVNINKLYTEALQDFSKPYTPQHLIASLLDAAICYVEIRTEKQIIDPVKLGSVRHLLEVATDAVIYLSSRFSQSISEGIVEHSSIRAVDDFLDVIKNEFSVLTLGNKDPIIVGRVLAVSELVDPVIKLISNRLGDRVTSAIKAQWSYRSQEFLTALIQQSGVAYEKQPIPIITDTTLRYDFIADPIISLYNRLFDDSPKPVYRKDSFSVFEVSDIAFNYVSKYLSENHSADKVLYGTYTSDLLYGLRSIIHIATDSSVTKPIAFQQPITVDELSDSLVRRLTRFSEKGSYPVLNSSTLSIIDDTWEPLPNRYNLKTDDHLTDVFGAHRLLKAVEGTEAEHYAHVFGLSKHISDVIIQEAAKAFDEVSDVLAAAYTRRTDLVSKLTILPKLFKTSELSELLLEHKTIALSDIASIIRNDLTYYTEKQVASLVVKNLYGLESISEPFLSRLESRYGYLNKVARNIQDNRANDTALSVRTTLAFNLGLLSTAIERTIAIRLESLPTGIRVLLTPSLITLLNSVHHTTKIVTTDRPIHQTILHFNKKVKELSDFVRRVKEGHEIDVWSSTMAARQTKVISAFTKIQVYLRKFNLDTSTDTAIFFRRTYSTDKLIKDILSTSTHLSTTPTDSKAARIVINSKLNGIQKSLLQIKKILTSPHITHPYIVKHLLKLGDIIKSVVSLKIQYTMEHSVGFVPMVRVMHVNDIIKAIDSMRELNTVKLPLLTYDFRLSRALNSISKSLVMLSPNVASAMPSAVTNNLLQRKIPHHTAIQVSNQNLLLIKSLAGPAKTNLSIYYKNIGMALRYLTHPAIQLTGNQILQTSRTLQLNNIGQAIVRLILAKAESLNDAILGKDTLQLLRKLPPIYRPSTSLTVIDKPVYPTAIKHVIKTRELLGFVQRFKLIKYSGLEKSLLVHHQIKLNKLVSAIRSYRLIKTNVSVNPIVALSFQHIERHLSKAVGVSTSILVSPTESRAVHQTLNRKLGEINQALTQIHKVKTIEHTTGPSIATRTILLGDVIKSVTNLRSLYAMQHSIGFVPIEHQIHLKECADAIDSIKGLHTIGHLKGSYVRDFNKHLAVIAKALIKLTPPVVQDIAKPHLLNPSLVTLKAYTVVVSLKNKGLLDIGIGFINRPERLLFVGPVPTKRLSSDQYLDHATAVRLNNKPFTNQLQLIVKLVSTPHLLRATDSVKLLVRKEALSIQTAMAALSSTQAVPSDKFPFKDYDTYVLKKNLPGVHRYSDLKTESLQKFSKAYLAYHWVDLLNTLHYMQSINYGDLAEPVKSFLAVEYVEIGKILQAYMQGKTADIPQVIRNFVITELGSIIAAVLAKHNIKLSEGILPVLVSNNLHPEEHISKPVLSIRKLGAIEYGEFITNIVAMVLGRFNRYVPAVHSLKTIDLEDIVRREIKAHLLTTAGFLARFSSDKYLRHSHPVDNLKTVKLMDYAETVKLLLANKILDVSHPIKQLVAYKLLGVKDGFALHSLSKSIDIHEAWLPKRQRLMLKYGHEALSQSTVLRLIELSNAVFMYGGQQYVNINKVIKESAYHLDDIFSARKFFSCVQYGSSISTKAVFNLKTPDMFKPVGVHDVPDMLGISKTIRYLPSKYSSGVFESNKYILNLVKVSAQPSTKLLSSLTNAANARPSINYGFSEVSSLFPPVRLYNNNVFSEITDPLIWYEGYRFVDLSAVRIKTPELHWFDMPEPLRALYDTRYHRINADIYEEVFKFSNKLPASYFTYPVYYNRHDVSKPLFDVRYHSTKPGLIPQVFIYHSFGVDKRLLSYKYHHTDPNKRIIDFKPTDMLPPNIHPLNRVYYHIPPNKEILSWWVSEIFPPVIADFTPVYYSIEVAIRIMAFHSAKPLDAVALVRGFAYGATSALPSIIRRKSFEIGEAIPYRRNINLFDMPTAYNRHVSVYATPYDCGDGRYYFTPEAARQAAIDHGAIVSMIYVTLVHENCWAWGTVPYPSTPCPEEDLLRGYIHGG